jgi:hypothetical protein
MPVVICIVHNVEMSIYANKSIYFFIVSKPNPQVVL